MWPLGVQAGLASRRLRGGEEEEASLTLNGLGDCQKINSLQGSGGGGGGGGGAGGGVSIMMMWEERAVAFTTDTTT